MIPWLIYILGNLIVLALVITIMYCGILLVSYAYAALAPEIEKNYSDELKERLANSGSRNYWENLFKLIKDYWDDLISQHTSAKFKLFLVAGTVIALPLLIATAIFGYCYLVIYDYMAK